MLRGMGWKAGEGIGKTRKGVAPPVEAALRPKGLGLGADKTVKMKEEKKRPLKPGDKRPEEEENLTLKTGAHIVIESGKHKDLYAVVEGSSGTMSRWFFDQWSMIGWRGCGRDSFTVFRNISDSEMILR